MLSAVLTVENIVFNEPQVAIKAVIAATDINAAIRPYSNCGGSGLINNDLLQQQVHPRPPGCDGIPWPESKTSILNHRLSMP